MKNIQLPRVIGVGLGLVLGCSGVAATGGGQTYPVPLSPNQPFDVDSAALEALNRDTQIPEAQRLFDIFAWQTFVALNWPAGPDGKADPAKTLADNTSPRAWASLHEISAVYREDGKSPKTAEIPGAWKQVSKKSWAELSEAGFKPGDRVLWMNSKIHNRTSRKSSVRADESLQAFTGPLVDQSGKWVRYEVLMNDTEYDYVVEHELYNQEGQAKFLASHQVDFPANDGNQKMGSMEVKLAWKQLDPDHDDPSRFYAVEAWVVPYDPTANDKAGKPFKAKMGLVGMHVAVLTKSSPVWVWSTFEQVDCVQVNDLEHGTNSKGKTIRLRPLFSNPTLPTKLPNVMPPYNYVAPGTTATTTTTTTGAGTATSAGGTTTTTTTTTIAPTASDWIESKTTTPVQVMRVTPIADATEQLNTQVRALLADQKSVFRHYRLIGTQWPVQPKFPGHSSGLPGGLTSSPESIVYKVPGKVVPVYLVNVTMETYFQKGVQPAGPLAQDDRLPPGVLSDPTPVFGTESCAGCHFSAGAVVGFKRDADHHLLWTNPDGTVTTKPVKGAFKIPIYGQNGVFGQTGNAHFSWLLQLKAKSVEPFDGPID